MKPTARTAVWYGVSAALCSRPCGDKERRAALADRQNIAAGTPREVQITTLLQHAHSELTHDTIYKPSVKGTPAMLSAAAKSMALIESTNDYFEELVKEINAEVAANRQPSDELADIYRATVSKSPDPTRAEGLLKDAFATFAGEKTSTYTNGPNH